MLRSFATILLASSLISCALLGCEGAVRGGADEESSAGPMRQETTGAGETAGKECKSGEPTDSIIADPDGSYDKTLVRRAENIFVGRVIEKKKEISPAEGSGPLPSTSFAVRVERNVKGNLSGTVTVEQAGGCDPKYGRVVLINDDPLLKPGERAVFSTEKYRQPAKGHYIVGSNYGDMRIKNRTQADKITVRLRDDKKEYVPYRQVHRGSAPS